MSDAQADPVERIRIIVAASLAAHVEAGSSVSVALSGGRDSVVLLDALMAAAPAHGSVLHATHVHHGLSPNADAWQDFCDSLCERWGVPLTTVRVDVPRGPQTSLESEARRARYAALAEAAHAGRTHYVALAHHRDDQAETLLLQLLRGAGPHGLAAMAELRSDAGDVAWWRPLLDVARTEIDAYAARAGLRWVDDESNAATRYMRNAIRHTVMPVLASVAGNAPRTLARAAAHQAEAAQLLDDLAALDARDAFDGLTLARSALAGLPAHRARNLLRWCLRRWGLPAASSARLAAMLSQLAGARGDANVRLLHAGAELGVYQGRVHVHAPPPAPYDVRWNGEADLALPHGQVRVERVDGEGVDLSRIAQRSLHVRPRGGGERLQLAADRPRRALKSILQDAGVPPWSRQSLPLVYVDDELAAVPGIGVDAAFAAPAGTPGLSFLWRPADSR
jgi:tRNA(Ile)-lysidine synthase